MSEKRSTDDSSPSLHGFLCREHQAILDAWEEIDRRLMDSARTLSRGALINNIPGILDEIAEVARRGRKNQHTIDFPCEGAKAHAEQRWGLGFTLAELTREYALLRSVILGRMTSNGQQGATELVLLNQALDEAIIESVVNYVARWNRQMDDERERLQITLRGISDGVISTDVEGRVTYINPAASQICGWPCKEALDRPIDQVVVVVEEESGQPLKSLARIATESGTTARYANDVLLRRRDGGLVAVEGAATPLRDARGNFVGVVATFHDVSEIRETALQLGHMATHDALTGLPNRTLLIDRLTHEMAHARRHGTRLALLYLDLDLFKNVNDTLGHSAGDELLKQVARRVTRCIRSTDTVSRLGGDEFVVLLTEFGQPAYLEKLGAEIGRQLSMPYQLGSDTVEVSTSIGISVFPEDGTDQETLFKHADIAMYHAKTLGRNNLQFFAPEMNLRAQERRKLQADLRRAMSERELALHFQPQVALSSGRVIGAEALLRWRHPQHGTIFPDRFIPAAEESRQIMIDLGNWVLTRACRQARRWLDAGYAPLRLSVNVSMVQLQHDSLLNTVRKALGRYGLPADLLQLELTESVLMNEVNGALARVRALEQLGVRIAVDDFGTGYSSLSYLKDLPVDELKIDRSFVQNVDSDSSKAAIVQAVIRMGQSLKLRVIAEGVEEPNAAAFLIDNGCEAAQGFYYGHPLSAGAFERQFLHLRH